MTAMRAIQAHLQARDSERPLVLDVPPETAATGRLVAELYALQDGRLVMVDVGWAVPANPGHPFHVLQAPDEGGEAVYFEPPDHAYAIRPLMPEIEPCLERQWADWLHAREELDATREHARVVIEQQFGPTETDPDQ